jgi:hypothetical protein
MQQWEYKVEYLVYNISIELQNWLCEFGERGWELVQVKIQDHQVAEAIFKRPVTTQKENNANTEREETT